MDYMYTLLVSLQNVKTYLVKGDNWSLTTLLSKAPGPDQVSGKFS